MLVCPSCGAENPEDKRFCGDCGTKLEATPVREERKVITALFCDLVGSTALGERLDAEDISRLLRALPDDLPQAHRVPRRGRREVHRRCRRRSVRGPARP